MTGSWLVKLGRVAALIAGVATLAIAATISFGAGLLSPIGVWLAHRVHRARGRALSRWGSWAGAVGATVFAFLIGGAVVATKMPPDTWRNIRHAADSASVASAKAPPPAWISRYAPAAAPRSRTPPAMNSFFMIWGIGLVVGALAALVGTAGWVATMLLAFSATGRWLGRPMPIEMDADLA